MSAAASTGLHELRSLVLKTGLGIGGLGDAQRQWVCAFAATCLPAGEVCNEATVNLLLMRFLALAGAFLNTDHVELRRWLVDMGWWQRDGFGRAYQRTPLAQLGAAQLTIAQALQAIEPASYVAALRQEQQAQRDARKAAWQASQGA